jgi:putative SOS response-associated peptidase YedK
MCGRYRLSKRKQLVEEYFDAAGEEEWEPRYNIAPTQPVPIIRQHPKEPSRKLSLVRWGLIPSWAKDASGAAKMINARSESVSTQPAFREAFKLRRCLVPADGFYEWQKKGTAKQPFCFEIDNGELFAFAGLWDRWKDPAGQWIRSCSILTTTPNPLAAAIHDRMPVIVEKDNYDLWLDPGMKDTTALAELLRPCRAQLMRCYPVSKRVNQVQYDDPECAVPITLESSAQRQLFVPNP